MSLDSKLSVMFVSGVSNVRDELVFALLPFEETGCGSSVPSNARNADDMQTNMATFLTFELLVSAMS